MGYTNSSLISYTRLSPNKTSPRNHAIDTITIHCMAGNLSVERCGEVFAPASRQASSNYGVGSDGRIAMYVEEKDRSWCTSNRANDHRSVTIEVANDGGAPDWHVSDRAMAGLIELVADICRRNSIRKLVWSTDKADRIHHKNGCNMTVHRDYAAKACPGNYLYNKHPYIAEEVNKKLGAGMPPRNDPPALLPASGTYQVRLLEDLNIRKAPNGTVVKTDGAKKGIIYTIVETQGSWGKLKSGAGWICVSDRYVEKV